MGSSASILRVVWIAQCAGADSPELFTSFPVVDWEAGGDATRNAPLASGIVTRHGRRPARQGSGRRFAPSRARPRNARGRPQPLQGACPTRSVAIQYFRRMAYIRSTRNQASSPSKGGTCPYRLPMRSA